MTASEQASAFLEQTGMHGKFIDFDSSVAEFQREMTEGLEGKPSSLLMLPSYITEDYSTLSEKPVIVIDAGGTNLRVALCRFKAGRFEILNFNKFKMPGTQGELTSDEFFDGIARHLLPVIDKSDTIGFCFSYAVQMQPDKDGVVLNMGKEIAVEGIIGKHVCAELAQAVYRCGVPEKKNYVLLNDTVAAMLGAKAAHQNSSHDGFLGFILGTGTNVCYSESCKNITKDPGISAMDGSMIINMESGGYDRFKVGEADVAVDAASCDPGDHLAEKMISGAYMAGIVMACLRIAAKKGLLTAQTVQALEAAEDIGMREVDAFCAQPQGSGALFELMRTEADRDFCYTVIDCLYERSAKIVAVQLAGTIGAGTHGRDEQHPVCVCAEGTMFYKSALLRPKLDWLVKKELNEKRGIYLDFVSVEDATIIGSALAALANS